MCVQAARRVLSSPDLLPRFGIDPAWAPLLRASLDDVSLYGRFDLGYGAPGQPAKLLEYNADTPTGLVEAAVVQWYWLNDVHPDHDQWNSLHERLQRAWAAARPRLRVGPVHFAHSQQDVENEEWMTVAYMRDVAAGAGMQTIGLTVEEIGVTADGRFVGLDGEPITTIFKLYPWEEMLAEPFARHLQPTPLGPTWIEPAWKALLSNKALLPVLWEMFRGHPNLLPAYFDSPHDLAEHVAKPLHGREGAGVRVVTRDREVSRDPGGYGDDGYVYQAYYPLPCLDGAYPVIGSWVVDGVSAGIGIRESDDVITDRDARFVPHYLSSPRPSDEKVQEWLDEQ